jgi:hypothetical protein
MNSFENGYDSPAAKWRDDNLCTLDDMPAKIIGWKERHATVACLDIENGMAFQWSWAAVAHIMENGRNFRS